MGVTPIRTYENNDTLGLMFLVPVHLIFFFPINSEYTADKEGEIYHQSLSPYADRLCAEEAYHTYVTRIPVAKTLTVSSRKSLGIKNDV